MSNVKENMLMVKLGLGQDKDPIDAFYENPCEFTLSRIGKTQQTEGMVWLAVEHEKKDMFSHILKHVSKKLLTPKLCMLAVTKNGNNLRYVPEELRDFDMCLTAASSAPETMRSDSNVLEYVPNNLLKSKDGLIICKAAIKANSLSIAFVPKEYITKEMAYEAIVNSSPGTYADTSNGEQHYWERIDWPIGHIPDKLMSQELVDLSLSLFPASLACIPLKWVSKKLCIEVVQIDGLNLKYVPDKYRGCKVVIDAALAHSPQALQYVPKEKRTKARCLDAIRRDPDISTRLFPEDVCIEYTAATGLDHKSEIEINVEPISLDTPKDISQISITVPDSNQIMIHDLVVTDDSSVKTIYYVSDIHLEHQLHLRGKSASEIRALIDEKITELLSNVQLKYTDILLICGDTANSVELEAIFYKSLRKQWRGAIISVLGNHELWDGHCAGIEKSSSIDDIIADYRQITEGLLLENELLLTYRRRKSVVINEKTLLEAKDTELSELCDESSFIILGGIGFSGLNPKYNASLGLYRSTVSIDEDIERSDRFRTVYEKVLACAPEQNVIVLTHTQMKDWSNSGYNPNWAYISGHTHQNSLIRSEDGTTVLSDNQIGYEMQPWRLKGFTIRGSYDPFQKWTDGIYPITQQQYMDFNYGHGIEMSYFRQSGDIFVLKREGIYMFVLKDKRLSLLEGGRKHKLDNDIDYYYENMLVYQAQVRNAFEPYNSALKKIAKEVKAFGGAGTIHGCIVDIDFLNHIYLNPFDGKITPYFARDMTTKLMYDNVSDLLKASSGSYLFFDEPALLENFAKASSAGLTPILTCQTNHEDTALATVPEIILDRTMYEPSRIMRSIQYIFDQNVIRVWNDDIIEARFGNAPAALDGSLPQLPAKK